MHHEAKDRDPVWDCTLIKIMREHGDTVVNAIYDWTDEDIWQYIKDNDIEINPLYSRGYKRVGCIGCPLATWRQVTKEFEDYPKYKQAYIRAFDRMLEANKAKGYVYKRDWQTGEDVFYWWIEEYNHIVKGQMKMEDFDETNFDN